MVPKTLSEAQKRVHKQNENTHAKKAELIKAFTAIMRTYQRKNDLTVEQFSEKLGIKLSSGYDILSGNRGEKISYIIEMLDRIGYEMKYEFVKKEKP